MSVTRSRLPIHCERQGSTIQLDALHDGGGLGKGGMATHCPSMAEEMAEAASRTRCLISSRLATHSMLGEDWCTPVSPTYKLPFKFTGDIKLVTIEAKEEI